MLTIYPVAIFQYTIIYHFGLTGVRGGGAQPRAINYQPNIFGQTPSFQKFYFRSNTKFSNEIFSATQRLFILLHLFEPRRFGNKQFLLYYSIYLSWQTSWVFLILYSCL